MRNLSSITKQPATAHWLLWLICAAFLAIATSHCKGAKRGQGGGDATEESRADDLADPKRDDRGDDDDDSDGDGQEADDSADAEADRPPETMGADGPASELCDAGLDCGSDNGEALQSDMDAGADPGLGADDDDDQAPDSSATCGGLMGLSCDEDEFCNFPVGALCGAADATGTCRAQPEVCTEDEKPVCGCDGKTYGNPCKAWLARTSVASEGACQDGEPDPDPAEGACGGLQDRGCAAEEFCSYAPAAICGAADALGTCTPRPGRCPEGGDLVCGCDEITYQNECEANRAGTSVAAQGACEPATGQVCGTRGVPACPAGQFCHFPETANCGSTDQPGTCQTMETFDCPTDGDAVCGCDDVTYRNACEAQVAFTSVASQGPCGGESVCMYNGETYAVGDSFPSDDGCNRCTCGPGGAVACTKRACVDFCGGLIGAGCPDGQYCDFPIAANCGRTDQTGTCRPIPDGPCNNGGPPVCGCLGNTYDNACFAALAGESVAKNGACNRP